MRVFTGATARQNHALLSNAAATNPKNEKRDSWHKYKHSSTKHNDVITKN